jgi:D-xylose 1-dehydrogenase (NADP+, D-xylono-1,5-lactone-forming)
MSSRILRWGLLGTANINQAVITPLRMSSRNQLTAIASRTPDRAAAYAQQWQIPRHFGSYEAMLADPEIDVVYVSLPNSLHAEWTIKAAQAGKHVLCEKPLCVTVAEVDAVAAAAQAAGVVVAEAFMYQHHPQTLTVKEIVASGVLGQIYLVRAAFTFDISGRPDDVRLKPELSGGGLWDVGCYPVSYARTVLGAEPVEVFGWQTLGASGVDLAFAGQMRFPDGSYAQFDAGFQAPLRAHLEIVGKSGTLTVPHPYKPDLEDPLLLQRGEQVETIMVKGQELYLGEVEDMADCVLLGKAQRLPLDWSRQQAATLVALYESARSGKPVEM